MAKVPVNPSVDDLVRGMRDLRREVDRISGGGLLVRGDIDLRGHRLVNVGNAKDFGDATTASSAATTSTTTTTTTVTSGVTGPGASTVNAIATWADTLGEDLLSGAAILTPAGALSGLTTLGLSGVLTSTLATGTAPLTIASTTLCTNLNADLLDGSHASAFSAAFTNSAGLAALLSDETGTGLAVFATTPTLQQPKIWGDGFFGQFRFLDPSDPNSGNDIVFGAQDLPTGVRTILLPTAGGTLALTSDLAAYQPLDSDLTAIAALTTTAFGRGLLTETNASTTRTTLGLVIGTNVQAYDAGLLSFAAIPTVADRVPYSTAADTWAETPLTGAARTVLDDATVAAMVDTLGGASSSGTGGLARLTNPTMAGITLTAKLAANAVGTIDLGDSTNPFQSLYLAGGTGGTADGLIYLRGQTTTTSDRIYATTNLGVAQVVINATDQFSVNLTGTSANGSAGFILGVSDATQSFRVRSAGLSDRLRVYGDGVVRMPGRVRIGADSDPTAGVELDLTGDQLISGTLGVTGVTTLGAMDASSIGNTTRGTIKGTTGDFNSTLLVTGAVTLSTLTSGRIPIAGTAGLLGDDADLTFATNKLTASKIDTKAGSGTGAPHVGGTLFMSTTQATNVGGGTDDLISYTMPANTLAANGDWVRVTALFYANNNANNKTFTIALGAATVWTSTTQAYNNAYITVTLLIVRTGASAQAVYYHASSPSALFPANSQVLADAGVVQIDTNDLVIKGTGAGTADADCRQYFMLVEYGTYN